LALRILKDKNKAYPKDRSPHTITIIANQLII